MPFFNWPQTGRIITGTTGLFTALLVSHRANAVFSFFVAQIPMGQKVLRVLSHPLGCLIFLALPYLFSDDGFSKLAELPYNPHEQRNVLSYLLTIAFFYINYYGLIPRFFFSRNYLVYGGCVVVCFVLANAVLVRVNQRNTSPMSQPERPGRSVPPPPPSPEAYRPPGPPPYRSGPESARVSPPRPDRFEPESARASALPPEMSQTFFLFLAGMLASLAISLNIRWEQTERARLQTELAYLRAQINPHFLFNTLNSIYSLAIVESPPTAEAIVQLSSFLRYVITETRQERVLLSQELAYLGQYIALQTLRLGDTVPIRFTTRGAPGGQQIAPLILISFIENAFKYGASPQEPSNIDIEVGVVANELVCHVFNRKVRVQGATAVASGIGLTNTKARLALLYPGQHQLTITDKPDSFTVDLTITLS